MNSTKVVTGECRASYVNVFKPRLNELNGKEEFSMVLLVPKSDAATVQKLKDAIAQAKADKWQAKVPPGVQSPVHDGDGEKPNGGVYGDECHGHWVINLKSKSRPGIVDKAMRDVIDPNAFVSGDYCRVSINAYGYDQARKGVAFGLNNIQVTRKGEPLSSRSSAADDFGGSGQSAVSDDDIPF
jgi:hypothetical protein